MSAMITLDRLTRRFGDLAAVDGLDFEVERGELFGLVGPDGAGKTTTLRMLAGVLAPSDGDAAIDGVSVARHPERVKHRIAYMSQRFGLYTDLTVLENLQFYADLFRVPKRDRGARLERLFRFSGLAPFRDRLAGALSGGMKQKLGLSCALIHQPDLLLLDEPTFGVDPVSRRELWLIVHEMVAQGMTAVVSTAYMDEAERFDRLALLHAGRARALDTPVALREGFDGEILEARVDRPRDARARIESLDPPGLVRRAAVFGNHLHVTVDDAASARGPIERALREAGIGFDDFEQIAPSLEDVFIEQIAAAEEER